MDGSAKSNFSALLKTLFRPFWIGASDKVYNLKNSSEENSPEFQGQSIFLLSSLLLRLKVKELSPCTICLLFLFKSLKCLPTEIQPDTEYFILKHSNFCQEEYLKPFLSIENTFAKRIFKILMILLPRYS